MKDYKNEYENLLKEYTKLEIKYKKLNDDFYKVMCSRPYKVAMLLKKLYRPINRIKQIFKKGKSFNNKINKFIKNSEKVAIVPCSFEFDEFVNQRPINYAKYLADKGYKVIYVAWQWDPYTKINNAYKEVHRNIIQVPLYDFFISEINYDNIGKKIFYISFPNDSFLKVAYNYRKNGFIIHYDIMDEWEEFKKVGQADWYNRSIEEKFILEADYVTAVSLYLINKFKDIRSDIKLSPNGFYPNITGTHNKNIALNEIIDNKINIGYFGHLTSSWFDWQLLFDVAESRKDIIIHIIGYGADDATLAKIQEFDNIKYYGKIPTEELGKYVKEWNAGIIPFKKLNLSKAVDPIKIYEYIYMGLPTIVTGIEGVKAYPKTYYAEDKDSFIESLEKAVSHKDNENIDDFINKTTWDARFDEFILAYDQKGISVLYED